MARKLFTNTGPSTLATSHSVPSSPDLISSSQDAAYVSQDTIKSRDAQASQSSPTCSEDMFDSAHSDINLSHVMSSTPVSTDVRKHGPIAINTREVAVANEVVDNNCDHVENPDTSYHKLDTEVHTHTSDVELTDSPDCKPVTNNERCKTAYSNTSCSKGVSCDNSDLMDELFANHFANLTQLATEQLLQEEHKLTHSNQVANQTDSGCGDDVMHNDVMDHVINKDEAVTPITTANGFHHFTVNNTVKPLSSSDKAPLKKSKPFKAPRMAKEVGEGEKSKLLEEYCKKFPSLSNNKRTSCDNGGASSTDAVIACGFTSAGSGKKFTVSAAALQRAVQLVEDCTNDLFTEQHNPGSHGNTAANKMLCHVEEDTKMVATEKSVKQLSIPKGEKEAKETLSSKEETEENSKCGKEERSHDTTRESHEQVDNYGLDNIDMEQFSAFTQMPGYMRAERSDSIDDDYHLSTATVQQISDEIRTPVGQPSSVTPVQKEPVSSYITPGGSFNPCPSGRNVCNNNTTPCRQSADDEELKKMFSTQVVKQFLDFNSSNEDDDATLKVAGQLQNDNSPRPAQNDEMLPCTASCDADSHSHKMCSVTENDDHAHNGSHDDTNNPTHHVSKPPTSLPKSAVFGGFSTASGKSVTISDDAISKVKQLLDDACGDTINGRTLRDRQCVADDVYNCSPSAVQQLCTDDKADGDTVVTGNHSADDKSTDNTTTAVDDSHEIKVTSLNEPSYNAAVVLSVNGSCDPSPDTTAVMEATPVKINVSIQQYSNCYCFLICMVV